MTSFFDAADTITAHITKAFEDKLTAAQQARDEALAGRERWITAHTSFQDQVRDAVIAFAGEVGVDTERLNELLAELDLEPVVEEYVVTVTVTATQTVHVTVSATDASAAKELVDNGDEDVRRLVEAEIDGFDYEVQEYVADEVRAEN